MDTALALVGVLPELIATVAALIGLATAAWQAFRARDYRAGLERSRKMLDMLVTTIELAPDSEEKERLRQTVKRMSEMLGRHNLAGAAEEIDATVHRVRDLLRNSGVLTEGDDTAEFLRAGEAVGLYRRAS